MPPLTSQNALTPSIRLPFRSAAKMLNIHSTLFGARCHHAFCMRQNIASKYINWIYLWKPHSITKPNSCATNSTGWHILCIAQSIYSYWVVLFITIFLLAFYHFDFFAPISLRGPGTFHSITHLKLNQSQNAIFYAQFKLIAVVTNCHSIRSKCNLMRHTAMHIAWNCLAQVGNSLNSQC